jgi:molecular chaperone Hsp33
LEKKVAEVSSVTDLLDQGKTPEMILEQLLGELGLELLDKLPTGFYCDCSKEKVTKAVISIGEKDIREMIADKEPVEVKCHFCNKAYHFSVEELEEILKWSMDLSKQQP